MLPNGNVAIVVADVVGHGVAAAMFMAKLSAETRFALASVNEVDQAIILLNDRISSLNVERFVTFLVLVLNPQTSEVTIVNCGHMAPIWWRGDGRIEQPSEVESGLPIGITSGLTYDKVTITLQPGDSLTCYTDGINEAPNAKDVPFTINRIQEIVKQSNGSVMQIGSTLVEQVDEHVGELPQEDDMCIVVFGRRQYEESKTHANALRTISNRKPAK